MTAQQVQSLVTSHIQAHTAGKGRPTYLRVGTGIIEPTLDAGGMWRLDTDKIPVVVDRDQKNASIMACYGEVPHGAG
jgi:hypothetical protein